MKPDDRARGVGDPDVTFTAEVASSVSEASPRSFEAARVWL